MSTSVPRLPAVSRAVTVIVFVPVCRPTLATTQLVVPDAVPLPPRSLTQLTDATPALSLALPASDMVALVDTNVDAVVGPVIVIDGAVVSAAAAGETDQVND